MTCLICGSRLEAGGCPRTYDPFPPRDEFGLPIAPTAEDRIAVLEAQVASLQMAQPRGIPDHAPKGGR